jgi:hypothetical protein
MEMMKRHMIPRVIAVGLAVALLAGCTVYQDPYAVSGPAPYYAAPAYAPAPAYYAPPAYGPAYVAPSIGLNFGFWGGGHGGGHHHGGWHGHHGWR